MDTIVLGKYSFEIVYADYMPHTSINNGDGALQWYEPTMDVKVKRNNLLDSVLEKKWVKKKVKSIIVKTDTKQYKFRRGYFIGPLGRTPDYYSFTIEMTRGEAGIVMGE
jgi:hypothetical protein